jgi:hypothetical protein
LGRRVLVLVNPFLAMLGHEHDEAFSTDRNDDEDDAA